MSNLLKIRKEIEEKNNPIDYISNLISDYLKNVFPLLSVEKKKNSNKFDYDFMVNTNFNIILVKYLNGYYDFLDSYKTFEEIISKLKSGFNKPITYLVIFHEWNIEIDINNFKKENKLDSLIYTTVSNLHNFVESQIKIPDVHKNDINSRIFSSSKGYLNEYVINLDFGKLYEIIRRAAPNKSIKSDLSNIIEVNNEPDSLIGELKEILKNKPKIFFEIALMNFLSNYLFEFKQIWTCTNGHETIYVKKNAQYFNDGKTINLLNYPLKFKCGTCKEELKPGTESRIEFIEKSRLLENSIFFSEILLMNYKVEDPKSQEYKSVMKDIFGNIEIEISNRHYQQIIKLIKIFVSHKNLKQFVSCVRTYFSNEVRPVYKSGHNFIFSSFTLFNGFVFSDRTPKQVFFEITKLDLSQDTLDLIFLTFRELFYLQIAIKQLLNQNQINFLDCYNYIIKLNLIFKIIFGSPIFKSDVLSYFLPIYENCTNSRFILEDNKKIMAIIVKNDSINQIIDITSDFNNKSKEIILLCGLCNQIVSIYQLMFQSRKKGKSD